MPTLLHPGYSVPETTCSVRQPTYSSLKTLDHDMMEASLRAVTDQTLGNTYIAHRETRANAHRRDGTS